MKGTIEKKRKLKYLKKDDKWLAMGARLQQCCGTTTTAFLFPSGKERNFSPHQALGVAEASR